VSAVLDQGRLERRLRYAEDSAERLLHWADDEGLTEQEIRSAAHRLAHANVPLRDEHVLREAHRRKEMATDLAREAWARAFERLGLSLPGTTFELWIRPLELAGEADGFLYLIAPDAELRVGIERSCGSTLSDAVLRVSEFLGARVIGPVDRVPEASAESGS
jgi:hypothetical protein